MKIAIVYPISPKAALAGGMEQFGKTLSLHLLKKNHQVEIFMNKREKRYAIEGVKIHEVKAYTPQDAYFFSPELFFALRKSDADLIHCNGYNNFFTLIAMLAKKKNQKLVLTLHNSGSSSALRRFLLNFYDFAMNLLSSRIDLVIYTTNSEYEEFSKRLKIPKEKAMIINYGLDLELLKKTPAKKQKGLIVSIGRMVAEKGFAELIRGFAVAAQKNKTARLRLIGDGPDKEDLKKLAFDLGISKRVEFYGIIPIEKRTEYIKVLKESEIVALLCSPHTNPQVVIESIAAGIPTITTNAGAPGHYVKEGFAVGADNVNDSQEVGKKLLKMLENPAKFTPKKPGSISWDEYCDNMISVYKKLLGGKN